MKATTLFFLILTFSFLSCSTSDEGTAEEELIVGVWKPIQSKNSVNGSIQTQNFSDCVQQSRYAFSANGDLEIVEYSENSNEECEAGSPYFQFMNGTWEKLNGNNYEISFTYYYPESDDTKTESELVEIVFLDNNEFEMTNLGSSSDGEIIVFQKIN